MRVCGQQRPAGRSSVMREYKMKSRINHAASALLIFLLLSMVSLWATGNLHIRPIAPAATADEHTAPVLDACGNPGCTEAHAAVHEDEHHADHAHEHDDHAGHDHPVIKDPADLEAILKIECEHDILIADCDECRYEVGLVKIGPEVSRTLLEIEPVSERTMGGVLKLTGRIESDRTVSTKSLPQPPAGSSPSKSSWARRSKPVTSLLSSSRPNSAAQRPITSKRRPN